MDNGTKWMFLDGHVGYGDWHHQIAEQLAPRAGINDHDSKAISNYALVNAIPAMEGHDIAWGHLHHNMPVIWNTNVDRNAVNDAVSRGISAADMASQSDGGRGIASDSLNSDDYNQNGGNVSVAGWHEAAPWMDQSDPMSWRNDPTIKNKRNQPGDWTELQPKDEYANEDWSDPREPLRQHLQELADNHGINLKYWGTDPNTGQAKMRWIPSEDKILDRSVRAARPISPQHYMAAMHEFGHQLADTDCMGTTYDEDWNVVPRNAKKIMGMYYQPPDAEETGGVTPLKRLTPNGHAALETEARAWKWALQNAKIKPTPAIQGMMHKWMNSYIPVERLPNNQSTRRPESVNPVPPTWQELRETYPEGRDNYWPTTHDQWGDYGESKASKTADYQDGKIIMDIEERRRGSVFGNQAPWYIADGRVIVGNYGQTAEEIGWEEGMTRGTVDILGALTCHAGRAPRLEVEAAVRRRYAGMEASFPVEAAERARKARSWWVEA